MFIGIGLQLRGARPPVQGAPGSPVLLSGHAAGASSYSGAARVSALLSGTSVSEGTFFAHLFPPLRLAGGIPGEGAFTGNLAQILRMQGSVSGDGAFSAILASFDNAETQTLINAMTVAPSSARASAIDNLISGLKTDGLWDKMDLFYLMAAHDEQAGRLNWKDPSVFELTKISSGLTFTTDKGFSGDGVGAYLNPGFVPATDSVVAAFDSCATGFWIYDANTSVTNHIANTSASTTSEDIKGSGSSAGHLTLSPNTGTSTGYTSQFGKGHNFAVARTVNVAEQEGYRDGVSIGAPDLNAFGTLAQLSDGDLYFLRASGASFAPSSLVLSCAHWGGALSDVEAANLYSRLNSFETMTTAPDPVEVLLTTAGANSWTVPADWNDADNSIECWGAGGSAPASSNGGGGGGGAYSKKNNLALTPSSSVSYFVGAANQDTFFGASSFGASSVAAKGGAPSSGSTRGLGGAAANGIGDIKFSGGNGANGVSPRAGGGGAAAGPDGAGGNGAQAPANNAGGGGGGGNGGGNASGLTGGAGFNGGGNGANGINASTANGQTGGAGSSEARSGGGGSGGSAGTGPNPGGNGGGKGGGAGGGNSGGLGGTGASGLIRIRYTPIS